MTAHLFWAQLGAGLIEGLVIAGAAIGAALWRRRKPMPPLPFGDPYKCPLCGRKTEMCMSCKQPVEKP